MLAQPSGCFTLLLLRYRGGIQGGVAERSETGVVPAAAFCSPYFFTPF
jgi:hypothetical protein